MSKYYDTAFFGLLLLMIVSFPFSIALNSIMIGAFALFFLLDYKHISVNFRKFIHSRRNILLLILFLSLVASAIYSENKLQTLVGLIRYIPLVALPLCLIRAGDLSIRKVRILKMAHIAACLLASLICLIIASVKSGLWDGSFRSEVPAAHYIPYFAFRFTYHQLSDPFHLHAIYFALFISLAVFFIITELQNFSGWKKACLVFLLIYFLLVMILLKATAVNFAMFSIWLIYLYLRLPFRRWQEYAVFLGLTVFATVAVSYLFALKSIGNFELGIYLFDSDTVNTRFLQAVMVTFTAAVLAVVIKKIFKDRRNSIFVIFASIIFTAIIVVISAGEKNQIGNVLPPSTEEETNVGARFSSWKASWILVRRHPILGTGYGDHEEELLKVFSEINYTVGVENKWNAHNQYLQFWIAAGITAFLSFVLLLTNELYQAIRSRNFIALAFTYCFAMLCMSEVILQAQIGMVFFAFFICLVGNANFRPQAAVQNGKFTS